MSAESLMTMTCSIERKAITKDSGGGVIQTFSTHLNGVRCEAQDRTGDEAIRYNRETGRRMVMVYIEGGHDITEADRIVLTNPARTLDIQHVDTRGRSGSPLYRMEAECEETK